MTNCTIKLIITNHSKLAAATSHLPRYC